MTGGKDGGWPEDFDFESVKIQERIPLPLNVLLPTDVGEVVSNQPLLIIHPPHGRVRS